MDPLVKAHLRIAALEQELQEPTRIKAEMGSSFSAHYLRVIPLPGDFIRCAEMKEPKPVLQFNSYVSESSGELVNYVVSGDAGSAHAHTCRPSTCLGTIRIMRRSRSKIENSLLRAEFGKGNEE